jgi:hypothetical protein
MLKKLSHLGAPFATVLLLAGMSTADKLRVDPSEADGFHAAAAAAICATPKEFGQWMALRDTPLPSDAAEMLKPNGYLDRTYFNYSTGRSVEVLLDQCRDSRDMQGHYPPVCYPSRGCQIAVIGRGNWSAGGLTIPGTEYTVTWPNGQQTVIRNFFVLPNGRIVADMESVNAAAKDYRELAYGVAQVQLLFDASVGGAERDAMFSSLIGANRRLIEVLSSAANLAPKGSRT